MGFSKINVSDLHSESNGNILVSLQFTEDHTNNDNLKLKDEIFVFVKENPKHTFYLNIIQDLIMR